MQRLPLTIQQARNMMLTGLGLLTTPDKPAKKADVSSTIRMIHNLQIDTISVVARAHQHILWSRLDSYDPNWLDELHAEGALFEYYAHAACYLPIEDYPLYLSLTQNTFTGWRYFHEWADNNPLVINRVLEHIRSSGPARSADFKNDEKRGAWWDWKAEKMALEYLYYRGDLMISQRRGFQRVYDLRERVLPNWNDSQSIPFDAALRELILRTVRTLGVARREWIPGYFYLPKTATYQMLTCLKEEGLLLPAAIQGLEKSEAYIHSDNIVLYETALANKTTASLTTLLSPFDPLISDRKRTSELFDFDYQIECYTPAPKRKYGYFLLPILHKGVLVGRLDAKAWRKEKYLQVIKIFLEPGVRVSAEFTTALARALLSYAAWQGLESVRVEWSEPSQLSPALQKYLVS